MHVGLIVGGEPLSITHFFLRRLADLESLCEHYYIALVLFLDCFPLSFITVRP